MRALATALALVALPATAHASPDGPDTQAGVQDPGVDLQPVALTGLLDEPLARRLERAAREAKDHERGLLLTVDSPGGRIAAAEKAMLSVLFGGIPVVAWVPPGGQAAGAALFPLMGSDLIAMAPTAHLGTRRGLGRLASLALGPFGDRLFAAARESRSGSVDWMVVSVSDGGRIDARGAARRGVAGLVVPDTGRLLRSLRGRQVTIPLTGEVVTLSGRQITTGATSEPTGAFLTGPVPLALLCALALCLLAWGVTHPTIASLFPVSLVALAVIVPTCQPLPVSRTSILLLVLGAGLPALRLQGTRGSLLAVVAGPLLALGLVSFVDVERTGFFLDESARVPATLASTAAALLVLGALILHRLGSRPEHWKAASNPVELPRTR